jgi:hypothetical protein
MSNAYDVTDLTDLVERARRGNAFIASVALLEAFLALRQERDALKASTEAYALRFDKEYADPSDERLKLLGENHALREKCAELEPRALREGDEYVDRNSGFEQMRLLHPMWGRPDAPVCRLVRVPILAAAEPPTTLDLMNAEYAARYPKLAAASPEREPEKPPYAPFELKNDPITPEPERERQMRREWNAEECPAPCEAEHADADVGQLRFIEALGHDGNDASVIQLSAQMSFHRTHARRRMAVELARRRLAERSTLPPQPDAGEAPLRQAVNKRGIDPTQLSGKSAAMAEQIEKLRASGAIISTSERDRHWLAATAERAALRKIAEECNEAYIRGLALDALLGEVKA